MLGGPTYTTPGSEPLLKFRTLGTSSPGPSQQAGTDNSFRKARELFRAAFSLCFMCPNSKSQIQILKLQSKPYLTVFPLPLSLYFIALCFVKWFPRPSAPGRTIPAPESRAAPRWPPLSTSVPVQAVTELITLPGMRVYNNLNFCFVPGVFWPFSIGALCWDLTDSF